MGTSTYYNNLEQTASSLVLAFLVVAVTTWAWKVVNWAWLKPKKLERKLRSQGFDGRPYRFLKGDLQENVEMLKQAKSRSFDFSDDPALRVLPLPHHTVRVYGKKSFTWFGPIPRVHIMNPEHIKEVFTKTNEYPKSTGNALTRLLASGLASYNGDKWSHHRRILNPAFHQEKLKLMVPVFHKSCKETVDVWERLVASKGGSSCEVDVWPYLQNMTCDIISRTAFGSSYQEGKRIFDLLKELSVLVVKIMRQVYIPGWRFIPTKINTRMKKVYKEIQGSLKGIIRKREKAMKIGDVTNNTDILGLMIESNQGANDITMTIEEVIEECKLFYFAGQETTSVLLGWTMIMLSKHPDWQERARQEILHVLGNNDVPNYSGLGHLKIMTMILYEVLRLYPPVVMLNRAIEKDTKLGDVTLPAGVQIILPAILIHKDTKFWGSDAGEFNPERFSEGVSQATKNQQQVAYFPFGWGPRICIGQSFALLEAKMALAIILKRFSFELSPSYVHAPSTEAITLQPQYGVPLLLRQL